MTDYTGMIFKYTNSWGKTSTWLISGPPYKGDSSSSPAVRCTVTGKTFKETNGFGNCFLAEMLRTKPSPLYDCEVIRGPGVYPKESAYHKDSVEKAKLKNKINYLKGVIANSQAELKKAEEALDKLTY